MLFAFEDFAWAFKITWKIELVKFTQEGAFFVIIIGDVVIRVGGVLIQDIDVKFVELWLTLFMFLALADKGG